MSALRKIARRTFLIGSVAVAGGVAFGSYQIRRPHDNPLLDDLPDGAASFNPWVRIDTEAVTLITPHADLGQGVAHMQALLIAEELDLAENGFRTEFGLPAAAYYNRAFGSEAGADLAAVTPLPAAFLENAINTVAKLTGLQGTGGSTSVPDSFDKLREAGAVARETLKAAASAETGIPVPDLRTEAGEVVLPDGTAIPYTALAARAATIAPVTDVRLRDPGAWTMLGRPTHRLDIDAKSRGQQSYGIDLDMPGMVYASVKLSPRRSAVVDYDAGAAEGRRGVQAIFEIDGGVAVVANNTWRAIEAARAITLTTEPAAYPADQDGHWQVLSESFTDAHLDAVWRDDGDLDAATGDTVVTAEYRAPYVAHQPLEPLNAVALVTDSTITIWAAQQMPTLVKQIAAAGTDHDPDQVIFHNQYSGGSFGHRLEMDVVRQAVAIADQMRGTPVKLTYSREEDFAQDYPRGIAMARGHATLEGDRITGVALDIAAPSVIASQAGRSNLPISGPDSQITAGAFNAPYNFDAFRVRGFRAPELAPISSWRSVGASSNGFFIESLMDEVLAAAGADPVEARLALISDPIARGVLEAAAEAASWGTNLGANRGRGVALVKSFGVPVAEIIDVTVTDRGIRLDDVYVAADPGTVIDPINIENNIQGGVIWGLGHAINSEITYADGMAQQANYYDAEGMRMHQVPRIHVILRQNQTQIRGIGEPPVPPAAPALANAIFDATGQRLREMPFWNAIDFV